MSTICLYVKGSAHNAGTPVMTVTRQGPEWTGPRLRLLDASELGLRCAEIVGWSDFYGGGACDVHVARASDGRRDGWLVWGGNLGLRSVPAGCDDLRVLRTTAWDAFPLLWVESLAHFPPDVARAVAGRRHGGWATEHASVQG